MALHEVVGWNPVLNSWTDLFATTASPTKAIEGAKAAGQLDLSPTHRVTKIGTPHERLVEYEPVDPSWFARAEAAVGTGIVTAPIRSPLRHVLSKSSNDTTVSIQRYAIRSGDDVILPTDVEADERATLELRADIAKVDTDERLVFGFAKMAEDPESRGHYYIDKQGDLVHPRELETAAYEFVLESRDGGTMHETAGDSRLVESIVFTPEKLEKMGLPTGSVPDGAWWVGYRVDNNEAWEKVKRREYTSFSIEGSGVRKEMEA